MIEKEKFLQATKLLSSVPPALLTRIASEVEAVLWAEISRVRFGVARGTGRYGSSDVAWFGAANAISNTESTYVVFSGRLPDFVCFGPAESPLGPPGRMEILRTSNNRLLMAQPK